MRAITANTDTIEKTPGMIDRWCRQAVLSKLKAIRHGCLTVHEGSDTFVFGDEQANVQAQINIHAASAYRRVLLGGTIGSGEGFMFNDWDTPDVKNVVELFLMNEKELGNMESSFSGFKKVVGSISDLMRFNSIAGAKKNIRAHYDLNNDFFGLFLDSSMMYSSAIFKNSVQDLESAAKYKLDHICRRLNLKEGEHLVEIGTGWGGLGLSDKVTVLNKDYRLLEGKFDKLVSVEMIEAVGHRYLHQFFKKCNELLKDSGVALVQAITTGDRRFEKEKDKVDFIRKYIFPGGCLPSNLVMASMLRKHTDMHSVGYEDITSDYAETLAHWRARFLNALPEVKNLGFDDVFIRMWDFYLAYCEGGFRQRVIHTGQFMFAKPDCRWRPPVASFG